RSISLRSWRTYKNLDPARWFAGPNQRFTPTAASFSGSKPKGPAPPTPLPSGERGAELERLVKAGSPRCTMAGKEPHRSTSMPANLTPQYLEAEAEFKRAQSAEERLAALKKMWALLPKHKGTDKLQAELKAKMSEAREEVEHEKRSPKKGGLSHKVPKQGAGQYVLLGAPNAGKSLL